MTNSNLINLVDGFLEKFNLITKDKYDEEELSKSILKKIQVNNKKISPHDSSDYKELKRFTEEEKNFLEDNYLLSPWHAVSKEITAVRYKNVNKIKRINSLTGACSKWRGLSKYIIRKRSNFMDLKYPLGYKEEEFINNYRAEYSKRGYYLVKNINLNDPEIDDESKSNILVTKSAALFDFINEMNSGELSFVLAGAIRAKILNPDNPGPYRLLARIHSNFNNKEAARDRFKTSQQLEEENNKEE